MIQAVWQGILTGLVLATFTGPIFFAIVELGLRDHVKGAAYLAFGTFVSDISTIVLIYLLARNVDHSSVVLQAMYIVGGLVLTVLGLQNLLMAKGETAHIDVEHTGVWKLFARGFLINSTNPNVFFFWFGAVMVAVNTYADRAPLVLVHFISALTIVFSTDFLKGYGASLLRPYIRDNTLKILSRLSGLILIYFGLKLMFFH
jgi:threonine/homoserine/homoserine lactone efflux protein